MLYVLDPRLTGADTPQAADFLARAVERLELYHPVTWIKDPVAIHMASPTASDGVILVNGDAAALADDVVTFLIRSANAGTLSFPVALDGSHRLPPEPVAIAQSFDVVDELRRSSRPAERIDMAARSFARSVLSRVSPTFYRDKQRVFVCYRRADGEGIAAELDRALSARHELVFRDLVEIQVGDPASERIDEALARADVVVFVDTPRSGESAWVTHELAAALGRNIPIVWLRVGSEEDRPRLDVQPGPEPSMRASEDGGLDFGELADEILDAAFDLVKRHVRTSMRAFDRLRAWAETAGAEIQTLDQRLLIYAVSIDAPALLYPQRSRVHIVQLFARWPTQTDREVLASWLAEKGYLDHPVGCRGFDAAVMLRPVAGSVEAVGEWSTIDAGDHYVASLEGRGWTIDSPMGPTLLLVGAFPSEPSTHEEVIAAVRGLSSRWLELGGVIAFGGHPTFTPLILEAARVTLHESEPRRILLFQSAYFVRTSLVELLGRYSTVVDVPAGPSLDDSLSAMRRRMVGESNARLVVVIGGRTTEGGSHNPGVMEELDLARANGLPLFVVGGPGGQSAVIAEQQRSNAHPWEALGNGMTVDDNEFIGSTDDYVGVADRLWRHVTA